MSLIHLARQCFRYRELLLAFTARELRARYRGTLFGPLWMLIQPLFFLVVYFTVFTALFESNMADLPGIGVRHPLYEHFRAHREIVFALSMFVGLIPWISFSETITRATGCIMESGGLIKKFAFPSELLPVYLVLVSLINTVIAMVVLVVAVAIMLGSTPEMLWLFPVVLILQGIFTLGLAYIVSATAVYVRDLMQLVPILLTFVFFLSPIFYVTHQFTQDLAWILDWNPVTYLIAPYRQIFVLYPGLSAYTDYGQVPWRFVGILAAVAFGFLALGLWLFNRLKPCFADEI